MIKVMHITKLEPGRYTWITERIYYPSDSNISTTGCGRHPWLAWLHLAKL
jgi:hypothetical protein